MSRLQNLIPSFTRKPAASDGGEPAVRPWYEVKETPEAWAHFLQGRNELRKHLFSCFPLEVRDHARLSEGIAYIHETLLAVSIRP